MPIIDPSLQYFLLINDSTQSNNDDGYSFFLKYLRFAAHYINKKGSTIKAAIQFKRDLIDSIQLINDEFGCNFKKENDYEFQNNNNFYQYLFDKINRPNKLKESKRYIGTYKIGNDSFHTKFYQPHVLFSEFHSWYFSDTPIAILCVNSEKFQLISDEFTKQKIFQLIKLEIDLMAACDLTLVLCYNGFTGTENLLFKIIKDDQFAELHIDIFEQTFMHNFLVFMNENFLNCKHLLKGFIYLYSYFQKIKEDIDLLKKFKQILCTQTISFSMDPKEALKKVSFVQTKPFAHCKTGFDQYLRIFLCYTPIFNKSKPFDNPEMQPTEISDLCVGYIDSTQYFFKTGSKINIFFGYGKFENKNYDISFEDIHLLRPDLFVNDTLSLIPIDKDIHESIANVLQKVKNKFTEDEKSQKKYIHSTNFKNLIQIIRRVAYAYTYFKRNIEKKMDFTIRKTQIYAVIEACQSFLLKNKETKSENLKGIVYQIKTGEGKSCIIAMIAAVLAIKNITVHIVSSNIKLSNRDFLETFDFFKLFKLKSAILLHQNELPFSSNTIDSINNDYFDSMNNNEDIKAKYSDQFYHNDLFQNQLKMNFSVCGFDFNGNASNKADIVYSTFVNFECFFLHLMENCPAYIEEYYPKCGLLMDEVDSILIDEITNGTIISKEMKSNAKKILSLVYKYKRAEYKVDKTFELIKKLPKTEDIEIKDIEQMYKEIDIVNSKNFSRNYMIDSYTVKNKNRIKNLMANLVKTIIETKNNIQSLNVFPSSYGNHASKKPRKPLITSPYESLKNSEDFNCEEDEEDEEDEEEEEELNTDKFKVFKYIVPFDYNNKGIIEKNKEFSGFIPQFISLKEGDKDESIVFKDISISYLYVSHPIYAKLYGHICGFTGTVGSNDDKKIFSKQYELTTKKVSRYKPNLRVELPIFTCQSTKERDIAIANEIAYFHEKGNPVLAIFQDIEEIKEIIYTVYRTVRDNFVINIFDGSNDSIEPDYIGGVKGAITLGTNFCGRGTDIKCSSSYPLHVIVSYYTKNVRVMEQAFGRTARNGQVGTCRCICVENKIFKSIASFSEKIEKSINESDINARYQKEFINYYKKKRSWIFDIIVDKQSFTKSNQIDLLKTLRDSRINVNRIVAYKYQFPICMSIDRFLDIQSQKIFSIFNCPNCKYSWKIFQRYIRVMILQSWSLMINKFDQEKYSPDVYEKKLINRINELHKKLDEYLPDQPEYLEMIPTFVYICHKVINRYYDSETKYFKFNSKGEAKQIYFFEKLYKIFGKSTSSIFAQIGFKPFSLLSKSGARIAYDNVGETNFIKDPELSYEKQLPNNKFTLLSITERIDDLFNIIFQQMSSILGDKLFLKFFLRRTLAGCEFGICLNIKFSSNEIDNSDYLLIDKEPLFFATIYLWSIFPVLAGVLICVIIYLIGVAKKIYQNMTVGPVEPIQKKLVKAIKCVSKELIEAIYEKIIDYLKNILKKQIEKLRKICDYEADFFDNLVDVLVENDIYGKGDEFADEIGLSISAPSFLGDFGEDVFDGSAAFKISVLLILLFSCFIRVCFINKKEKIKNETVSDAKEYDSSFDKEKSSNKDPKVVEIETEETKKQINKISKSQKAKDSNDKESRKSTNQDKKAKELENEKDEKQVNKSKSEKALDSIVKKRKKSYEVDGNIDFSTEKKDMKRVNELIMKSKIYELLTNNELNHFYISHIESCAIPNEKVDLCFVRTKKKICKKVEVPIFVGNGLENVSNELYEKVFFFASKIKMKEEHPVLIPFVGFTLNSQKSYLMFDTLINDHRYSNFIDAYNREKLNSPIDFAYGISCAMEYIQKNKLFNNDNFPNLAPYNILLIDDAYPLIFPMDFKSNIIKNLKDFPELIPPELEKNPDDFSIQSCAFMFGKIALLMNATFNKSNTTEILNSCVSSDPHLRPTFSQICDSYENENMKRDRFRNHKVSYYFKKLMSIRKQ